MFDCSLIKSLEELLMANGQWFGGQRFGGQKFGFGKGSQVKTTKSDGKAPSGSRLVKTNKLKRPSHHGFTALLRAPRHPTISHGASSVFCITLLSSYRGLGSHLWCYLLTLRFSYCRCAHCLSQLCCYFLLLLPLCCHCCHCSHLLEVASNQLCS